MAGDLLVLIEEVKYSLKLKCIIIFMFVNAQCIRYKQPSLPAVLMSPVVLKEMWVGSKKMAPKFDGVQLFRTPLRPGCYFPFPLVN